MRMVYGEWRLANTKKQKTTVQLYYLVHVLRSSSGSRKRPLA